MSTPRPTPATMRGRKNPALDVRPVDYTSWRPARVSSECSADNGASATREGSAASPATTGETATPQAPGGAAPTGRRAPSRAAAASSRAAAHVSSGGVPKPGPAPAAATPSAAVPSPARPSAPELTVDPQLLAFVRALRENVTPVTATPQDAYYTVDSGHAAPPALEVPAAGVDVRGVWDVSEDSLRAVVADPEDTWSADLGRSDYYVRGQLCVQVTRADHRVVGIYRSGWAVARRPDESWADTADSLERTGAKPGGGGTRYPTNRRELLERLRGAGFEVTTSGSTHGKITHPEVPGRFLPFSSTPSSQRYGRHVVTAVKRVFGIDVR